MAEMTENERKVMRALLAYSEDYSVYYSRIAADSGLTITKARIAIKRLRQAGYVEFVKNQISDGSTVTGHKLTTFGRRWVGLQTWQ